MSAVKQPERFIMFNGMRLVEIEWPSDGRYDIGYQLARETSRPGIGNYMGLFELVSKRAKENAT